MLKTLHPCPHCGKNLPFSTLTKFSFRMPDFAISCPHCSGRVSEEEQSLGSRVRKNLFRNLPPISLFFIGSLLYLHHIGDSYWMGVLCGLLLSSPAYAYSLYAWYKDLKFVKAK